MITKLFYILFLFAAVTAFSQDRKAILGRVVAGDNGVAGVFVINKTAEAEVKTDDKGFFNLIAKAGDRIIVYSTRTIVREFTLAADALKVSPYVITVNYNSYELDEVVINKYNNLDAESLGLVPKGQKRRTVAERRLYTAGTFTVGTAIALDPIINAISGRTKMLRRAYATEKLEGNVGVLQGLYTEDEIIANYNIPKEKVSGFVYYLAEQEDFVAALKAKNKTYADFLLMELSKKYLKLQKDGQ